MTHTQMKTQPAPNISLTGLKESQQRVNLAAAYRLAAHFGYDDVIWNHLSVRLEDQPKRMLMHRFGDRFDEVSASTLVCMDIGDTPPQGEVNLTGHVIHSGIYRARADIGAIVHSHSMAATTVSALDCGFIPLTQDGMLFHKRLSYHEYEGLSVDYSECDRLAADLGSHNQVLMMRNHGFITTASSIEEAFILAYYLERCCQIQIRAMACNTKLHTIAESIADKAAQQLRQFSPGKSEWPALLRLLDQYHPGYDG